MPEVSGNTVNGLGEAEFRRPTLDFELFGITAFNPEWTLKNEMVCRLRQVHCIFQ